MLKALDTRPIPCLLHPPGVLYLVNVLLVLAFYRHLKMGKMDQNFSLAGSKNIALTVLRPYIFVSIP